MKRTIIKSLLTITLVLALVVLPQNITGATFGQWVLADAIPASPAIVKEKGEVVYATLGGNGEPSAAYVVNYFNISESGTITDYGDYTSVQNLSTTQPLSQNGSTISIPAEKGNLYYQGNLSKTDLPWLFQLSYTLDGAPIAPENLGGKSGRVEIALSSRQNAAIDATFYENYMLQISITLDADIAADIQAPGGTVASAGNNRIITYTALPSTDADIRLSAIVNDFSMAGIEIAAIPFSMDMDLSDLEDMMDDFKQLPSAIAQLHAGVQELSAGTGNLKKGVNLLADGSTEMQGGLNLLAPQSTKLVSGSAGIKEGLAKIAAALGALSEEDMDLSQLEGLPGALSNISTGLKGISQGLKDLVGPFSSAHTGLANAINAIPTQSLSPEAINDLIAAAPGERDTINLLVSYYEAGVGVKTTYAATSAAFAGVSTGIGSITAQLDGIAENMDTLVQAIGNSLTGLEGLSDLGDLIAGVLALNEEYGKFHEGLSKYINGVDALAGEYADFHEGILGLTTGTTKLDDGVSKLYDGTSQMDQEMSQMPDLDEMLSSFTGGDYTPISFTSSQNTNVSLVQFVIKCDGISLPEVTPDATEEESASPTPWDRFLDLFR
ncbi:hypothetical protein LJC20_05280 [Eubacteriales bacterium OttesenSCG-928-M02]|nr:hypothetical protein [Eubacteriales bacterium OttesenSCG-928-M02]